MAINKQYFSGVVGFINDYKKKNGKGMLRFSLSIRNPFRKKYFWQIFTIFDHGKYRQAKYFAENVKKGDLITIETYMDKNKTNNGAYINFIVTEVAYDIKKEEDTEEVEQEVKPEVIDEEDTEDFEYDFDDFT